MTDKTLPPIYSKDGTHDIASLRDYFASKAMQGLLSNVEQGRSFGVSGSSVDIANKAYRMADAMLKARGEQ